MPTPTSLSETLSRFKEGFAYTSEELEEIKRCHEICLENYEAIMGGYSASGRRFPSPEVPDLLERVRRGIQNVIGQ